MADRELPLFFQRRVGPQPSDLASLARFSARGSALALDRALVPSAQHQVREQAERHEDDHAGQRDQEHGREHARDVEPVARLEDGATAYRIAS